MNSLNLLLSKLCYQAKSKTACLHLCLNLVVAGVKVLEASQFGLDDKIIRMATFQTQIGFLRCIGHSLNSSGMTEVLEFTLDILFKIFFLRRLSREQ